MLAAIVLCSTSMVKALRNNTVRKAHELWQWLRSRFCCLLSTTFQLVELTPQNTKIAKQTVTLQYYDIVVNSTANS